MWRDVREVGTSLVMVPVWLALGIGLSLPWTWYLTVPAMLWIAGFMLVDRKRHPRQASEPGEPLLIGANKSLAQVEHQIWLLRNVFLVVSAAARHFHHDLFHPCRMDHFRRLVGVRRFRRFFGAVSVSSCTVGPTD